MVIISQRCTERNKGLSLITKQWHGLPKMWGIETPFIEEKMWLGIFLVFFLCLSLKREGMADQPLKSEKHFFMEIFVGVS